MRVLIATDGSKEATTALQTANRLLRPEGRQIDLLCVTPKPRKNSGEGFEPRMLSHATQILERARAIFSRNEVAINLLTAVGSPPASIVNRAEDYELTVIGPRGRGAKTAGGLGPVASRVAEHALAPVLVGRELRSEDGIRVLVATDGSTASMNAIETMADIFDLTGAEVGQMNVAETPWS